MLLIQPALQLDHHIRIAQSLNQTKAGGCRLVDYILVESHPRCEDAAELAWQNILGHSGLIANDSVLAVGVVFDQWLDLA